MFRVIKVILPTEICPKAPTSHVFEWDSEMIEHGCPSAGETRQMDALTE